ncbi:hypothetical protein [Natroniella sp. ANB-PHB2]|uniref:hypothetical protein n=1 Tax=Natroniella sp. ANB-PHB2 TaxID=3384444 RepID=UPI0038D37A40
MSLKIYVAGEDYSKYLNAETLVMNDDLDSINTCNFEMDIPINKIPVIGQQVLIVDSNGSHYNGSIEEVVDEEKYGNGNWFECRVECVDNNKIANRRTIAAVYEGKRAGLIVKELWEEKLKEEGVELGTIEDGPTITKAVFNYITVEQALDEICDITGYIWYIDYDKKLYFYSRGTNLAPFSLTDDTDNFNTLQRRRTREDYRNKQYTRGGKSTTNPLTVTFEDLDNSQRSFTLPHELARQPEIYLNGVQQSVGVRDVDSDRDFYWQKNNRNINQDLNGPTLGEGDVVEITYVGYFPIMTVATLDNSINQRRDVESGTGIYEAVEDDRSIDQLEQSEEKTLGLLRKHGKIPNVINFTTDRPGLRAGQLIPIRLSRYGLDDRFLIRNVEAFDINGQFVRYQVEVLDGQSLGGWKKFFKDLVRKGQQFNIAENEVVTYLRIFEDEVACKDNFSISVDVPESRVGYAQIGFSEIA